MKILLFRLNTIAGFIPAEGRNGRWLAIFLIVNGGGNAGDKLANLI